MMCTTRVTVTVVPEAAPRKRDEAETRAVVEDPGRARLAHLTCPAHRARGRGPGACSRWKQPRKSKRMVVMEGKDDGRTSPPPLAAATAHRFAPKGLDCHCGGFGAYMMSLRRRYLVPLVTGAPSCMRHRRPWACSSKLPACRKACWRWWLAVGGGVNSGGSRVKHARARACANTKHRMCQYDIPVDIPAGGAELTPQCEGLACSCRRGWSSQLRQ